MFQFLIVTIRLEVTIRRRVNCGHKGIMGHTVCQENILHTITPPPPLRNVDTRQVRSMDYAVDAKF